MIHKIEIEYDNSTEAINVLLNKVSNYLDQAKRNPQCYYTVVFIFRDDSIQSLYTDKTIPVSFNDTPRRLKNFVNGFGSVEALVNGYLAQTNMELYAIPLVAAGEVLNLLGFVHGKQNEQRFSAAIQRLTDGIEQSQERTIFFAQEPSFLAKNSVILGTMHPLDEKPHLVIGHPYGEVLGQTLTNVPLSVRPDISMDPSAYSDKPIILNEFMSLTHSKYSSCL
ncbi:hypothetical protein JOC36_001523 [Weissella uvarum]|uniref:hypothetical protein n=1 Tax=Weissella uvarum TaxID=1479233 RepID=UPI001961B2B7|nr:hypothetical protein [Weissella uvarum]MBM7617930.1 hypothetical protein [Weissella uvarum]MCM0596074.1 hypothetical protein [Weissella uvarum]